MMKNKLKEFLDSRGITGYELAKVTGIPQNTVYRIVNDTTVYPMRDVMNRILKTYPDTAISDLLEYIPDEEDK